MTSRASWRNVGHKIRHLRKENQLTIRQLATGCDLSPNAISLIERGEVAPTITTVCKVAMALGVSASSLFQEVCPNEVIVKRARERTSDSAEQALEALSCAITAEGQAAARPLSEQFEPQVPGYSPEFVLCLSGQLEYEADGQRYQLEPGDSLSFNGNALHCWQNSGGITAVAVMVLAPNNT